MCSSDLYPDVEPWRVASGFPELKKDGSLLKPEDEKAIMSFVADYACKVANMVSLSAIFKDVLAPPLPRKILTTSRSKLVTIPEAVPGKTLSYALSCPQTIYVCKLLTLSCDGAFVENTMHFV